MSFRPEEDFDEEKYPLDGAEAAPLTDAELAGRGPNQTGTDL